MQSPATHHPALLPLLIFSAVILALEVLLTKILSYTMHSMLLYCVLGIAMLGFGAAGSLVALRPGWLDPTRIHRALAWAALASCVTLTASFAVFVRLTPSLDEVDATAFLVASVLTLPFLCAGTVVTLALSSAGRGLGRCYAANLIGSGLGCFVPLALLGPMSGEQLLALLILASWGAAMLYVARVPAGSRGALSLASAAAKWLRRWLTYARGRRPW